MTEFDKLMETIKERHDLTARLIKALAHLELQYQIQIITNWMDMDTLKECVEWQELKND